MASGHETSIASLLEAEYTALRQEMGRYQDHQSQLQTLAILALGVLLAFISDVLGRDNQRQAAETLLMAPPLFAALALLVVDRSRRILDIAGYLHSHLRRVAIEAVKSHDVLYWEEYKREQQHPSLSLGIKAVLPFFLAGSTVFAFAIKVIGVPFDVSGLEILLIIVNVLTVPAYIYCVKKLAEEEAGVLEGHTKRTGNASTP